MICLKVALKLFFKKYNLDCERKCLSSIFWYFIETSLKF